MKKFALLLFLTIDTIAYSQNSNKDLNEMHQQIQEQRAKLDSSMKSTDSLIGQMNKRRDSEYNAHQTEQHINNLTGFFSDMKERERKQRQQMWMRIGFGMALLVIGIVAVMRRRKEKK
jgi:septal ring factor EnvC (AmiA/AmiB activator)